MKGEDSLVKRGALVVAAGFLSVSAFAAAESTSDHAFVYVDTAESSFWRTATNNVVSIPVEYPPGVESATLSVSGAGYSKIYEDVPKGLFKLTLPEAASPETENVYDLTLTFSDNSSLTARFGVIAGVAADASGTTRCISSASTAKWRKAKADRAVLPVPYGTTSLTVNGETAELDGAQGWYLLSPVDVGSGYALSLDGSPVVNLTGAGGGIILMVR